MNFIEMFGFYTNGNWPFAFFFLCTINSIKQTVKGSTNKAVIFSLCMLGF